MAFVVSVPIPVPISMPRFKCQGLQMAINIQTKGNIPILKTSIRNKHPRDYRVIDDMVGSTKTYKFMLKKDYQVNRGKTKITWFR